MGGVGGFYGGKLAHCYSGDKKIEVNFIVRGKHLEAIRKNGLKICSPDSECIAHPHLATDKPEEIGKIDLLLVCVKTYDLESAIELVSHNVDSDTVIIPLMNGMEGVEKLKNAFSQSKIFQGCCYLNSFVESPGVIKFRGGFDQVLIGFSDENKLSEVASLFKKAGITVYSNADISKQIWEKFIFGSTVSSIGSLENESFGEISSKPERKKLLAEMISELLLIAAAKGIVFDEDFKNNLLDKIVSYPFEARTSMQLDFANGKKTEIESFTGYVVRLGSELGIEVPNYQKVYDLLRKK